MAEKNIKLIQNEIADAVEKFNSRHAKKLVFKSAEKNKELFGNLLHRQI